MGSVSMKISPLSVNTWSTTHKETKPDSDKMTTSPACVWLDKWTLQRWGGTTVYGVDVSLPERLEGFKIQLSDLDANSQAQPNLSSLYM